LSKNIGGSDKTPAEKNLKEDEQTLADLISAHRRLQAQFQPLQTSYVKRIIFFLAI